MQITIHRGIGQIGGCITEISTATSRIFIDMGDNLPGNGAPLSEKEKQSLVTGLFEHNKRDQVAVFYTHSHSDHVGMMNLVPDSVPQYMSQGTHDIIKIKYEVLLQKEELADNAVQANEYKELIKHLGSFITWQRPLPRRKPKQIIVGDIAVTPYFVSHSTYDANMLLIEADGKTILHTGDYRGHGFLSKGLIPTLQKYIGQVDFLITEGTMLGQDVVCQTEADVSEKILEVMNEYKYVFIMVSSTDIERLAAIKSACRREHRILVCCSLMHYKMLEYFIHNASRKPHDLFDLRYKKYSPSNPSDKLIKKMKNEGFAMIVSPTHVDRVREILKNYDTKDTLLIYSSWDGYYKIPEQVAANPTYKEFRELFSNVVDIHTSGHADAATITKVIETAKPREGIIGIHKDANASLTSLDLSDELKSRIIPENKQINCVTIKDETL